MKKVVMRKIGDPAKGEHWVHLCHEFDPSEVEKARSEGWKEDTDESQRSADQPVESGKSGVERSGEVQHQRNAGTGPDGVAGQRVEPVGGQEPVRDDAKPVGGKAGNQRRG